MEIVNLPIVPIKKRFRVCKDEQPRYYILFTTRHVNVSEIFENICVLTVWAVSKHTLYLELEHMFSSHRLLV